MVLKIVPSSDDPSMCRRNLLIKHHGCDGA